jgi:transposase
VKRIRFTRRHLLAAAAGLAANWCVGPAAPGVAAAPAPGRPHRLDPCLPRQRVHCGEKGGAGTGANPTDRGKAGTKRHLVTDRRGIPLAFLLTGANTHDSRPFEDLLDAVPPVAGKPGRPRRRPDKLHADKAYDHRRCRRACLRRGIKHRIARRGIESSQRLGKHRWVIERTFAWVNRFRRLAIRYGSRHCLGPGSTYTMPSPRSPAPSSASTRFRSSFERRCKGLAHRQALRDRRPRISASMA